MKDIDPDAQCPEHGCANYRCDADESHDTEQLTLRMSPIELRAALDALESATRESLLRKVKP